MIKTNAETKFYIGTTSAFADATGYAGDTWTEVNGIEDFGSFGSESEIVVGKFVGEKATRKLKGQRDNGTAELVVGHDVTDPGFLALIAAEATSAGYNFKVELSDKPLSGASPKNTIRYFNAIVASAKTNYGGPNDIIKTTFSLAISGDMVTVNASAT